MGCGREAFGEVGAELLRGSGNVLEQGADRHRCSLRGLAVQRHPRVVASEGFTEQPPRRRVLSNLAQGGIKIKGTGGCRKISLVAPAVFSGRYLDGKGVRVQGQDYLGRGFLG